MDFHFRTATEADIPAIRELIADSVRTLQIEYSPSEREAAIATVFSVDTHLIADRTYFVADTEDGGLAGCGGWSKRKTLCGGDHQLATINSDLLDPATDAAKIRAIFVHPDHARQGLGSAILRLSEEAAYSAGFSKVEMGSTLTGLHLYRLKGYREVEVMNVAVDVDSSIRVIRMVKP